jgi:hypothetical protein
MTDGLRLAALRLHGVGAADRDWILDRLGRRERRALVALLRDLKRSGIGAAAADTVKQEISARAALERAEPAGPGVPPELVQADPGAVARALGGEPEWVRSAILAMHPWTWRLAALQRLAAGGASRPAPVAAAARPAVASALARALARRIAEGTAAGSSPFARVMDNLDPLTRAPRARAWERLRRWMR